MALGQPEPLRMFVHDKYVAIAIRATEQRHGVMGESVIQCAEPFARPQVIELIDDMRVAPERREELSGRNVPVAVEPCALLPARQVRQHLRVFRIVEAIVTDTRRNES